MSSALAARFARAQTLQKGKQAIAALAAVVEAIEEMRPLEFLSPADAENFVGLVRLARRAATQSKDTDILSRLREIVAAHHASALREWALGTLGLARRNMEAALAHFDALAAFGSQSAMPDLRLELGNLHYAYGEFDAARAAFRDLDRAAVAANPWAGRQLGIIAQVDALCGPAKGSLYPDCVVDVILDELELSPPHYQPIPDAVMTITNTLVHGGAERQVATLHAALARARPDIRNIAAVRSISQPGQDFFLPNLRQIGVEPVVFGPDAAADLDDTIIPATRQNGRLAAAVELLPAGLRQDMLRIAAIIVRERPQAVLVRHIPLAAALACALAGVPRTLFYSGTVEVATGMGRGHFDRSSRARQHTMRRLLQSDRFVLSNNSEHALASELRWLGFELGVYSPVTSAVDFAALDRTHDPAKSLRRDLGIGEDCFVLGGAFRLHAIKRPMLWLEAAALVMDTLPDAHCIVIGGGSMRDEMLSFAATRGFAARLHMPGAVADVGDWYRAMDLHLLTSQREGMSRALVEAQHFGVPVLAADVGGNAETMDAGTTGILLPADADARQFADAALQIWRDGAWRARAREAGPEFVHAKFDLDRNHARLLALLGVGGY
jgi:glycosyltransferase involved in cell wall biosynthesis